MTDHPATLTVEPFGVDIPVAAGERLLDAILRAGNYVPFGCNHGGCGTCVAPVIDGDVHQEESTLATLDARTRAESNVLLCSSYLKSPTAIVDLSSSGLTETEFAAPDLIEDTVAVRDIVEIGHRLALLRMTHPSTPWQPAPGQFVQLEIPGGQGWRAYSIASTSDSTSLDVLIRLVPGGAFTTALYDLHEGSSLRMRGPFGTFRTRISHRPKLFIAGGAGIGPIRAMIHDALTGRGHSPIALVHVARTTDDLAFRHELEALSHTSDTFTYHPISTNNAEATPKTGPRGAEQVTRWIDGTYDDAATRRIEVYLCGPDGFVDIVADHLIARGVRSRYLAADRFTASSGSTDARNTNSQTGTP